MSWASLLAITSVAWAVTVVVARFRPALLRHAADSRAVLVSIALFSAVAGAFASGDPTMLSVLNAALRAGVAVAFVLAGSRSGPMAWIVATVLVAGAAIVDPSGAGGTVMAALGIALAAAATDIRGQALGGLVGFGVAQSALRLQAPGFVGGPALVCFAALVILGLPALATIGRPARRRVLLVGSVIAGACVIVTGAYALRAVSARDDLQHGVDAARRALTASRQGDTRGAATDFAEAQRSFTRARAALDAPIFRGVRVVPIASKYADALSVLSRTGENLAATGADVAARTDSRVTLDRGQVSIARLRNLEPALVSASYALADAARRLAKIDRTWLVPPVADEVAKLDQRVARANADADTGLDATRVLPALLGGDGPRKYFVAFQTPAEARANGGIIGNFAVVSFEDGRFDLVRSGRNRDVDADESVPRTLRGPADYVARYGQFDPAHVWENITMSPDFPSVGEVIEDLYPQSGGSQVDGVVSVDPIALGALLQLTGPVQLRALPVPLSASNAAQVLLRDQYLRFPDISQRIDFLGEAINAVIDRLKTGTLPPPAEIARTLGPMVREGRLKLYSSRTPEQRFFERIDVDGALPPVTSDFIGLATQNASGNKIDVFAHRSLRYEVSIDASGRAHATATITLRNDAPRSGLPPYVIEGSGPNPTTAGESRIYVSFYSPLMLRRAVQDGRSVELLTERELGRNVFSTMVIVPSRSSVILRLDLDGPVTAVTSAGSTRRYGLTVWNQPTAEPDSVQVTVRAADATSLAEPSGLTGDQDRLVGSPASAGTASYAFTLSPG